jgi:catechol 2,3-dioxygenase-like lactoylglutathione lyase family enzyme
MTTPDLERAVGFYRDLLGFEEVERASWERGSAVIDEIMGLTDSAATFAFLRGGNTYLELFEFTSPAAEAPLRSDRPVTEYGLTHICLDVDDAQGEYERLAAAGMEFNSPPRDFGDGAIVVYGRDPDGNVVELQQLPEGSSIKLEPHGD